MTESITHQRTDSNALSDYRQSVATRNILTTSDHSTKRDEKQLPATEPLDEAGSAHGDQPVSDGESSVDTCSLVGCSDTDLPEDRNQVVLNDSLTGKLYGGGNDHNDGQATTFTPSLDKDGSSVLLGRLINLESCSNFAQKSQWF